MAMRRFVGTVDRHTRTVLDARRIDAVVRAYLRWAQPLGSQKVPLRLLAYQQRCRDLSKRLRLGYAVWEEPSSYGKDMWVQVIAHNDTSRTFYTHLYGTLWASRVSPAHREAPVFPRHRRPGAWEQSWGGGSGDMMNFLPHSRSTQLLDIGDHGRLHMRTGGRLYDVRLDIPVYEERAPFAPICALPIVREH